MHLTLKTEATKPAAANVLQQQARFDTFIDHYNHERPHQALAMKVPAEVYTPVAPALPRAWPSWSTRCTTGRPPSPAAGGSAGSGGRSTSVPVFAGQNVGVRQVSDRIWLVSFMDYDLGYFDDETCRLEPIENPFGPKVLPMSPE